MFNSCANTPFTMSNPSQEQPNVAPDLLNRVKTFLTSQILYEDWKMMENIVFREGKTQFIAAVLTTVTAGLKSHDIVKNRLHDLRSILLSKLFILHGFKHLAVTRQSIDKVTMDIFTIAYALQEGEDVQPSDFDCLKPKDGNQPTLDRSAEAISSRLLEEFMSLRTTCLVLERENKKLKFEISNRTKTESIFSKMSQSAKTKRFERSDDDSSPPASKKLDNCPSASTNLEASRPAQSYSMHASKWNDIDAMDSAPSSRRGKNNQNHQKSAPQTNNKQNGNKSRSLNDGSQGKHEGRRGPKTLVIGKASDINLKGAPKKHHFKIGNFPVSTTVDQVRSHIETFLDKGTFEVERIQLSHDKYYRLFHVTIDGILRDKLLDDTKWDENIRIQRYFMPRQPRSNSDVGALLSNVPKKDNNEGTC